mmetsp:Transcript_45931/g.153274  ORF Transcript_45931/g.153274 Transcript_45931/m.153274 type:complete len:308 (+) Transcript_45931:343-1266(+)
MHTLREESYNQEGRRLLGAPRDTRRRRTAGRPSMVGGGEELRPSDPDRPGLLSGRRRRGPLSSCATRPHHALSLGAVLHGADDRGESAAERVGPHTGGGAAARKDEHNLEALARVAIVHRLDLHGVRELEEQARRREEWLEATHLHPHADRRDDAAGGVEAGARRVCRRGQLRPNLQLRPELLDGEADVGRRRRRRQREDCLLRRLNCALRSSNLCRQGGDPLPRRRGDLLRGGLLLGRSARLARRERRARRAVCALRREALELGHGRCLRRARRREPLRLVPNRNRNHNQLQRSDHNKPLRLVPSH